jgi:DNA-binding NarL/FixJ family response regulator
MQWFGGAHVTTDRPGISARGRKRVVVVDDQPDMRDLVTLILDDEADFVVVGTAGDGKEAVRVVEELVPDLVVMDIAMPVMSGVDATRALRASTPTARIVFLTAHPRDTVDAASRALADDYLDKTVVVSDLVQRLRAVCERPAKGIAAAG